MIALSSLRKRASASFCVVCFSCLPQAQAQEPAIEEFDSVCVLKLVQEADVTMSIGEVRDRCKPKEDVTLVEQRNERERTLFGDKFSILLHRDNYLLPVTHNRKPGRALDEFGEAREIDAEEIKFQISLKSLLLNNLPFDAQLFAAYTNQSHWQAYNTDDSRPFRETNHQPEIFVDIPLDRKWRGVKLNTLRFGLNHQSNGRSGVISRSWNRTYAELLLSTKYSEVGFKTWWQVSTDEDNPDIDDYMGNFQLEALRKIGKHQLHLMLRHNLKSESRGAIELGVSRNLGAREDLRLYLQYFNGYGESLIDYDRKTERIGLGFKIGN